MGAGLAGIAAAVSAAGAGKQVCLIERRTFPGAELMATQRPWLTPTQLGQLQGLFGWAGSVAVEGESEAALVPDLFKIALEDRLLAAGVQLLYAVRPVGVSHDGVYQVEMAGKFGRRVIAATAVVDATENAVLARRFGGAVSLGQPAQVWRTLELTGVDLALPLPPEVRLHAGHAAEHGHVLLEYPAAPGEGWASALELARRVRQAQPGMRVTGAAYEAHTPPQWQVTPTAPGLFVAGACSGRAPYDDPAGLARHGWEVGLAAAEAPAAGPVPEAAPWPVEHRTADVLVVGGGTSGASCSVGAARQGARTLLVEMNPGLGGTGTLGGVDSYWFGRKGGFNAEISRRVAQEHAWMGWTGGKWNIPAKMQALSNLVAEAGVEVLLDTVLVEVRVAEGRVTGALLATPDGLVEVAAGVTVDCTGDGDAAVQAGADWVYGSDGEGVTMWYSMIPYLRPGVAKNNFTSTVDVGDPLDYTRAILSARRRLTAHDHGIYVAPRESRHILGGVRLTLTDIVTMRRWPDVINIHFSNHDVKGQNTSDWLRMGFLPPNLEIEVPYRAVLPTKVEGLLVAGKAVSATHDALPPIRMQADLENLGFICGTAAGICVARGTAPRDLPVRELQEALVLLDLLPAEVLTRKEPPEAAMSEAEMLDWINRLDDSVKLYHYGEMPMSEVRREPVPIVMVCTAGEAILPLLRAELAKPGSPRRLMVARALAWYGDRAATPVLLDEIAQHLAGDELPRRTEHISYTQASPDHGAMPELCYLLHSLAMARDPRSIAVLMQVAERLNPTMERFTDQHSGLFHYVDAICDIAERLGDPACVPALKRIHAYPLFRGRLSRAPVQADYFEERLAYLESTLGRAMARCGEQEGLEILTAYLQDSRRMLVRHAHLQLKAITGVNPANWKLPWGTKIPTLQSTLEATAPAPAEGGSPATPEAPPSQP